jgi:tRNA threonylcarbamoyladenosine biosynthesis protein TsaB
MIVLALDTATPPGSCAVARDGVVLREIAGDAAVSHAARLPRDLMRILDDTGLTLAAVDVFAVASGPGSFTGARVGIATMQGLAFASGRALFGISALDALACAAGSDERLAAWIGAWRGEVYAALYEGGVTIDPPVIANPAALLAGYDVARLQAGPARADGPLRFAGDGAVAHWDQIRLQRGERAVLAVPPAPLLAGTVALLTAARAAAGERPRPGEIRQLYIRRPDTELPRHDRPV